MKSIPSLSRRLLLALFSTALSALVFTGCSKRDRDDATTQTNQAYQDTKAATTSAWGDVKSYTYEKRDDFRANAKAMSARMDAQLSEVRANYSEANASASRKAAMAALKDSEADYKAKLDALGNATADTWDSAKQNAIAAWDKFEANYQKAKAD